MRLSVLLGLMLAGCSPTGLPCQTDADCGKDGVCRQVNREPSGTLICTHACVESKDCVDLSPCAACQQQVCQRVFASC